MASLWSCIFGFGSIALGSWILFQAVIGVSKAWTAYAGLGGRDVGSFISSMLPNAGFWFLFGAVFLACGIVLLVMERKE